MTTKTVKKKRYVMTLYAPDATCVQFIRSKYNLSSDAEAIRFSLNFAAKHARAEPNGYGGT